MNVTISFPMSWISPATVPISTLPFRLPPCSCMMCGLTILRDTLKDFTRHHQIGDEVLTLLEALPHELHGLPRIIEDGHGVRPRLDQLTHHLHGLFFLKVCHEIDQFVIHVSLQILPVSE